MYSKKEIDRAATNIETLTYVLKERN